MSTDPATNSDLRSAILRMFLEPADLDYVTARTHLFQKQAYAFYWSAAQAIEKYLKCALLLNGCSVVKARHNLSTLLGEALTKLMAPLPLIIMPPSVMKLSSGSHFPSQSNAEPLCEFTGRIQMSGDPNNRYRHYSLAFYRNDIHKLDEVIFQLRRICFPFTLLQDESGLTFLQRIATDPNFQGHGVLWCLTADQQEPNLEYFAKHMNYSFYSEFAVEEGKYLAGGASFYNSAIINALEDDNVAGHQAVEWMLDHMFFSNSDRTQLHLRLAALKSAQGA